MSMLAGLIMVPWIWCKHILINTGNKIPSIESDSEVDSEPSKDYSHFTHFRGPRGTMFSIQTWNTTACRRCRLKCFDMFIEKKEKKKCRRKCKKKYMKDCS